VVISINDSSYVISTQYPMEISLGFPIPNDTHVSLGSNVISLTTINILAPYDAIYTTKTIAFSKGSLVHRKLGNATVSNHTAVCGYYDESNKNFSSDGCSTAVDVNEAVICRCNASSSNFYVIYSDKAGSKIGLSRLGLILAIVLPIAVVSLTASIIIAIYFRKKCKRRLSNKKAHQVLEVIDTGKETLD